MAWIFSGTLLWCSWRVRTYQPRAILQKWIKKLKNFKTYQKKRTEDTRENSISEKSKEEPITEEYEEAFMTEEPKVGPYHWRL